MPPGRWKKLLDQSSTTDTPRQNIDEQPTEHKEVAASPEAVEQVQESPLNSEAKDTLPLPIDVSSSEDDKSSGLEYHPIRLPARLPSVSEDEDSSISHDAHEHDANNPQEFHDETEAPQELFSNTTDAIEPQSTIPAAQKLNYPQSHRVGILGGKGVGKTYLFQAAVFRTLASRRSGALSYLLRGGKVQVFRSDDPDQEATPIFTDKLIEPFRKWSAPEATTFDAQTWYTLRLEFRSGWFGQSTRTMDIEFFDASGEALVMELSDNMRKLWDAAFGQAETMVFCLPMWVAFPRTSLSHQDYLDQEGHLHEFHAVLSNYRRIRELRGESNRKVRSILALTMADDPRCALTNLTRSWITPFSQNPSHYTQLLSTDRGLARYLAHAQLISKILYSELLNSPRGDIARIPDELNFRGGALWCVPMSAVDGEALSHYNRDLNEAQKRVAAVRKNPNATETQKRQAEADLQNADPTRRLLPEPVPIHIELPFLVALCAKSNALM